MNSRTRLAVMSVALVAFGCFVYATAVNAARDAGVETHSAVQTSEASDLQPAVQSGECPYSAKSEVRGDSCSSKSSCSGEKKKDCADKTECTDKDKAEAKSCSGDSKKTAKKDSSESTTKSDSESTEKVATVE